MAPVGLGVCAVLSSQPPSIRVAHGRYGDSQDSRSAASLGRDMRLGQFEVAPFPAPKRASSDRRRFR